MSQNSTLASLSVFNYSGTKLCDLYDSQNNVVGQAYQIRYTTNRSDGVKKLTFQIPYIINQELNFRWEYLKNEYLIRLIYNNKTEWFIAQKPVKHKEKGMLYGDVTCAGTEITLKTKNIYKEFDDTNGIGTLPALADKVLAGTGWHRGYTDTIYEADGVTEKVRSITSGGKQGALGLITTLCSLFKCYPVYKSATHEVEFYSVNNHSQVLEGVVGVNLDALVVTPESNDIVTRLYVEGEYADDGYIGIDSVNPTGLSYIMNFDYYRSLGLFTAAHETALNDYYAAAYSIKHDITTAAQALTTAENNVNNYIGQCKLVVYYDAGGYTTPKYVYGDPTAEQQALHEGDTVIVLNSNKTFRKVTCPASPASLIGSSDYGIAKFITPAAGSIGAYEVQIEAKQQEITNLQRKINATTKADKIAEYNAEIDALNTSINTILTQSNGLNYQIWKLACSDGYLYDLDRSKEIVAGLQADLDDAESDFIIAMGDMLRDGYWNNHNYIEGQEQHLYDDAVEVEEAMSKPQVSYSFKIIRLSQQFNIPMEDFVLNGIFKIIDNELKINDNLFISQITIGIDEEDEGIVDVTNKDLTASANDLGQLLSRMSQLSDLVEQKHTLYDRAKAISNDNTIHVNRLNGQIDVLKNQLISTVSNWHTDEQGNVIFESLDRGSAMMLCGAGFMIANSKDDQGEWIWRTFGTGEGFTADEIVAGFISAERIEAGSILVDKLGPNVGSQLVISSNPSIIAAAENIASAFSASRAYAVGEKVAYKGNVYRFTTAHPAGAWNASHVTRVNVDGEYYDKVSGITIENDGVDIYGGKYVKIRSGGFFLVDATDFKIDSVSKEISCRTWSMGFSGLLFKNDNYLGVDASLRISGDYWYQGETKTPIKIATGVDESIYWDQLYLKMGFTDTNDIISGIMIVDSVSSSDNRKGLLPTTNNNVFLGTDAYKFYAIYGTNLYGTNFYGTNFYGTAIDASARVYTPVVAYKGSKATTDMIRFINNTADGDGNGISVGGGGVVIIGAGESASGWTRSASEEKLWLLSDEDIHFLPNRQNSNTNEITITSNCQITRRYINDSLWVKGRDNALLRMTNGGSGYHPIISAKSMYGSWELGCYTSSQSIYLTWINDDNYNSNNNVQGGQYEFRVIGDNKLADVASSINSISRSGGTFTATRLDGRTFTFTQTWRGFQVKQYQTSYTVAAHAGKALTGTNFGVSTPSGYTPVAIAYFNTSNSNVNLSYLDARATGGSILAYIYNTTNATITNTMAIAILYLQN